MDELFKALGDETRRLLLDTLHEKDGLTLTELETSIAAAGLEMSRFGVMKHLKVLETASLIVSRKEGRFKYHYLNALPLQQAIDRWIEPLMQKPMARAALELKSKLEGENSMNTTTETKPDFVLETYIKTTPQKLWNALTDGELSKMYFQGNAVVESSFEKGAGYKYLTPSGDDMLIGKILEADPVKKLSMTFRPAFMEEGSVNSHNVYEIEEVGESCKLTIMHFGVTPELEGVRDGWSKIAARLKTFLETGETLDLTVS